MKKLFLCSLILAAGFAATSCTADDENVVPTQTLSADDTGGQQGTPPPPPPPPNPGNGTGDGGRQAMN